MRITRLCDEQGRQYVIANGDITQVFNASRGAVKLTIDIAIMHEGNIAEQITELRNIMAKLPAIPQQPVKSPLEPAGILITGMDSAKD